MIALTDTIHSTINLFILSTDAQNQHNIAMPSPSKKTFSSIKNILLGHKLILMEEPFKLIAFIIGLRSITFRSQCTMDLLEPEQRNDIFCPGIVLIQ